MEEEKVYSWLYALAQSDKDLVFEYVRSTERGECISIYLILYRISFVTLLVLIVILSIVIVVYFGIDWTPMTCLIKCLVSSYELSSFLASQYD